MARDSLATPGRLEITPRRHPVRVAARRAATPRHCHAAAFRLAQRTMLHRPPAIRRGHAGALETQVEPHGAWSLLKHIRPSLRVTRKS
ncbi:protein of unknown function [Burkholderia multivorans]